MTLLSERVLLQFAYKMTGFRQAHTSLRHYSDSIECPPGCVYRALQHLYKSSVNRGCGVFKRTPSMAGLLALKPPSALWDCFTALVLSMKPFFMTPNPCSSRNSGSTSWLHQSVLHRLCTYLKLSPHKQAKHSQSWPQRPSHSTVAPTASYDGANHTYSKPTHILTYVLSVVD